MIMKITSLISASALALTLAMPAYAQTAPAGIPAAYVNVAAIQQVKAQLAAQGFTITDVIENADGSYSILSSSAAGELRLITVNPGNGEVIDSVNDGFPAGTPQISQEGTFEHEANETGAMEGIETNSGTDGGADDTNGEGTEASGTESGPESGPDDSGSTEGTGGEDSGTDSEGDNESANESEGSEG